MPVLGANEKRAVENVGLPLKFNPTPFSGDLSTTMPVLGGSEKRAPNVGLPLHFIPMPSTVLMR